MGDVPTPVLDRRKFWDVLDEEPPWCLQQHKVTKHFRVVNTEKKLRYLSTRKQDRAEEEYRERLSGKESGSVPFNLPFPTLGGHTFWTDVATHESGWRVQKSRLTGHYRLLDPKDGRYAWGFDQKSMTAAMEKWLALPAPKKAEENWQIAKSTVSILLPLLVGLPPGR